MSRAMYYVKTTLKADDFLETALTQEICDGEDGNVFTRCPGCGEEFHVDLADVFAHDGDLFSTSLFCEECSKNGKSQEWADFMNGKIPTFNGKTRADMDDDIDTALKKADEIIGESENDEEYDRRNEVREIVQMMADDALWRMPEDKVKELYSLVAPYYNPDAKDE